MGRIYASFLSQPRPFLREPVLFTPWMLQPASHLTSVCLPTADGAESGHLVQAGPLRVSWNLRLRARAVRQNVWH